MRGLLLVPLLLAFIPLSGAQEPPASEWMIHLYQNEYIPDPMHVPPGAVVTVMNFDPEPHTVTAVERSHFDVTNIEPDPSGQKYRTFTAPTEPGEYPYYCIYHGDAQGNGMFGTLIVDPSTTPPATPVMTPAQSPPAPTPPAAEATPPPTADSQENATPVGGVALVALGALVALLLRRS